MEWQPIETAPTDGTTILVYGVDGSMWTCLYCGGAFVLPDFSYGVVDFYYWMPLPAPPTGA